MKINYFVSYAYEQGFGQIHITCDRRISSFEEIEDFRETIKKITPNIKSPVILFFKEI